MMKTEIIKHSEIEKAVKLIKAGELVVFPTETVYGIGADAYNDDAVRMIFLAKKRPITNPLIVHVESIEKINELVDYIPKSAMILMQKFTPGPLTFILKNTSKISKFISGGLDSIAVRIPSEPIALKLIQMSGVPIAAPSANLSRRPSATNFEMAIKELNGLVKGIIKKDGGSRIGIESTVIGFNSKEDILILRPGSITKEMIAKELKEEFRVEYSTGEKMLSTSPGNLLEHYKPSIPVYLFNPRDNIRWYAIRKDTKVLITRDTFKSYWFNDLWDMNNICIFNTLEEYAKNIYKIFVESEKTHKQIIAEFVANSQLGYSINNRLKKASLNKFIL
ncbi:L-threonylcarbamoyladenylate synthase [Borrelia miyamotoi]|uniref:Threonylcarbamoyl-AMP synthase n=1 Tax=Borrelia miyamotoi TaxID=47466 RepID=A0AAX3JNJ6_9SPIR|nr:L-threonylcarbamoyladenylate synthase [Borrelia miyamotoi]QFP47762.2 L-threonylcarbamoyladenylate synthase [Borrelia miyamotoi]WAZ72208.1 L-threonylcarbamoyladenylate synthase [Borrelia miyamotoi]